MKFISILSLIISTFATVEFAYAENTDSAGQFYERAIMEYRNDNKNAAILELKNAIQQNPDYLAAYILLAKVYLQNKELITTEVALNQADKLGADPELLVMTRAQLYLHQLKYDQLIKDIVPAKFNSNLQADLYIYRGHAYLQLNQLAYALNEYKIAATMQPNRIEPIIGRANVMLRLNNIEGATKAAEQAALLQPNSASSWYIKGSINHVQGYLQEALTNYQQTIKSDSQHQDARIARAGILMDLNRDTEAEIDLNYLRKNYPFDAKAAYLHAVILARNNKEKEANEALLSAAEILDSIEPKFLSKHSQTLMLSGLVNYSLKRFDIARHYLELYIKKHPNQMGAYKLLSSIFLDKGEYEKAINLLKPIQASASNDYRLLFILGTAYMQHGLHDQANAFFKKASKLGVKGTNIQTEIGLNRLAMGQEKLAIQELNIALENNPGNTKAGIPLTIMYLSQRQPEKAMDIANRMYQQTPDNLTLLNLLGTTQIAAKKYQLARESFEKAITQDPEFITAQINLSKLDVIVKKPDIAKQRLQDLSLQHPENIALMIELATIHQIEKKYDIATNWLKKAIKLDFKSIPARLALIELKLKINHPTEALMMAQEAQQQDRNNMQVLDILARCFIANNNKSKAIGVLQNMSQNAGFNAKQLFKIAQQQYLVADYSSAIKSLKKAISGNQHHIPSRIVLAELELEHGQPVLANNHAKFLTKQYSDRPFGYRLLGDLALQEGKLSLALQQYQTAFEKEQNSFLLMKLYATLKKTNNNEQAFQRLEQWVDKHPQDIIPVQALAEEHLHANRLDLAQKYYERLLQQLGEKPDLLNNLAYIYFNTHNEKALDFAQQAQALTPDSAATNDTLGWILVNNKQPERGLNYLRTAYARASQDPEIRYHIAEALYQLQRFDEARTELKAALKTNVAFNDRKKAKLLLKKLSH